MRKATILIAILVAPSTVGAQSPEQIIAEVGANRDRLKAVRVEMTLKTVYSGKMNNHPHMPRPESIPPITTNRKIAAIVDFTKGRYRWDHDGDEYDPTSKGLVPYRGSTAYDGTTHRSVAYPRNGPTDALPGTARRSDFAELSGDLREKEFNPGERALFFSFGVLSAGGRRPLYPGGFHTYDVRAHTDTVTPTIKPPANLPGVWLTTVMTAPDAGGTSNRYSFDPKLGFALVHYQTVDKNSVPFYSGSLTYQRKNGRAVLTGWTFENHADGIKMTTRTYTVTNIDYDYAPADPDFELRPEFGMTASKIVYDPAEGAASVVPAVAVFTVAENGELIALDKQSDWLTRNRWIVIGLACVAIPLFAFLLIRRMLITPSPRSL